MDMLKLRKMILGLFKKKPKERSYTCELYGSFEGLDGLISRCNYRSFKKIIQEEPQLALLKNKKNETLLMRTALHASFECFDILVYNGAAESVNEVNQNGRTALMITGINDHYYIARKLLELGADISIRDNKNKSFFDYALEHKKSSYLWITMFLLYKDQLDEKDTALYKEYRLQLLFT
jgi:ankyrin repeat protein